MNKTELSLKNNASEISIEDYPEIISSQIESISELEKSIKDSDSTAKNAMAYVFGMSRYEEKGKGIFKHKSGNTKEIIDDTQNAVEKLAEAQQVSVEALIKSFEFQRKLADVAKYLFELGCSNIVANETAVRSIKAKLSGASGEQISALARHEAIAVLKRLKEQQNILKKQEELKGKVKKNAERLNEKDVIDEEQSNQIRELNDKLLAKDGLDIKQTNDIQGIAERLNEKDVIDKEQSNQIRELNDKLLAKDELDIKQINDIQGIKETLENLDKKISEYKLNSETFLSRELEANSSKSMEVEKKIEELKNQLAQIIEGEIKVSENVDSELEESVGTVSPDLKKKFSKFIKRYRLELNSAKNQINDKTDKSLKKIADDNNAFKKSVESKNKDFRNEMKSDISRLDSKLKKIKPASKFPVIAGILAILLGTGAFVSVFLPLKIYLDNKTIAITSNLESTVFTKMDKIQMEMNQTFSERDEKEAEMKNQFSEEIGTFNEAINEQNELIASLKNDFENFQAEHNQTLAVYDEKISNLQTDFNGAIEILKKEIEELRIKILDQEKLIFENLNKNQNNSTMQNKEQDVSPQENNDSQELLSEKTDPLADAMDTVDDKPVMSDSFDNETVESDIQSIQNDDNNIENSIGKDESTDVLEINSTENENIDPLSVEKLKPQKTKPILFIAGIAILGILVVGVIVILIFRRL